MLSVLIAVIGVYVYGYIEHCRAVDRYNHERWLGEHEEHHCSKRGYCE